MNYSQIDSLETLRAEKRSTVKEMKATTKKVKKFVTGSLIPGGNTFLQSDVKYLRYIGYGIVAFKAMNTVRRIVGFFTGRR